MWQVRYAGGDEFILLPTKGAAYLHILLAQPGTSIPATKLAATVARHAMDHLLALCGERTRIVPGYGPVMTRAQLQAERDMMKAIYDRAVDRADHTQLDHRVRCGQGATVQLATIVQ